MKKKVLFVQYAFEPPGGACLVAAWMLQALKDLCNVTVLSWRRTDWNLVNRFYGTSLQSGEFAERHISPLLRPIFRLDPDFGSVQKIMYLLRKCKRLQSDFDLCVAADCVEADFGAPGMQYVHYPYMVPHYNRYGKTDVPRSLRALLQGKIRPWMYLGDYSFAQMKRNLTLVNSDWTGNLYREGYGADCTTVYPPSPGEFPDVPWERREPSFLCLGNVTPAKRIDLMIDVLSRVRASHPYLRMHIVGGLGKTRQFADYYDKIAGLVRANASWITLHENLPRAELIQLAVGQRFGMHANVDEHFGVAVADLVRAGCIPFVHNSGGQVEIVGREPALIYDGVDDAVERIRAVLDGEREQARLRSALAARKALFTPERFMDRIRELAADFFSNAEHRQPVNSEAPAP